MDNKRLMNGNGIERGILLNGQEMGIFLVHTVKCRKKDMGKRGGLVGK